MSGSEEALQALGASTPVRLLGSVGGDVLKIECPTRAQGTSPVSVTLAELAEAHRALAELLT